MERNKALIPEEGSAASKNSADDVLIQPKMSNTDDDDAKPHYTISQIITIARDSWNTSCFFFNEARKTKRAQQNNLMGTLYLRLFLTVVKISIELFSSFPIKFITNCLQKGNHVMFLFWIKVSLLTVIIYLPVVALDAYYDDVVVVRLQEALSEVLLNKYMHKNNFFKMLYRKNVDNPGQRISDDIITYADGINTIFLLFINQPLRVLGFTGILIYTEPKCLFIIILWSTIVVGGGLMLFGKPLSQLTTDMIVQQATYRASIVRIEEHAESIGFYNAENEERQVIEARMNQVLDTSVGTAFWNAGISATLSANWFAMELFPYIILAPQVFNGSLHIGDVTQVRWAFGILMYALAIPLKKLGLITSVRTTLKRIHELYEECDALEESNNGDDRIVREDDERFEIKGLTYSVPPPHDTMICEKLNLILEENQSMMIVGDSGCGKSSLLKTLAGLWSNGEGTIVLPQKEQMMFLPQSPYMPALPLEVNTLREQLLFPWFKPHMADIPDKNLIHTLEVVNLGHLLERHSDHGIDNCAMWNQVLSLGEQQRLAMARVLLSEAKVVFLDESTSAMDERNEQRMYDLLREQNIWYVSIGHHKKLADWHDKILLLHTNTNWEMISHEQYFGDYHKEAAE